ncbi:cytochrome c, partial [Myxococcota bacterium]|nr:cytochrome c [Myxococcota bacterium]
ALAIILVLPDATRAHAQGTSTSIAATATSTRAETPPSTAPCTVPPRPPRYDVTRASRVFAARCAVCHGARGLVDGPLSRALLPTPRSFADPSFRVSATPQGRPSTDEEMFCAITRGVPGSIMMGWGHLSADDRWALVGFVQRLSPHFAQEQHLATLRSEERPAPTAALLARGVLVYAELGCSACHDDEGRGRGPVARDTSRPVGWPADHPFALRPRTEPQRSWGAHALHGALVDGLRTWPMPSASQVSADEDLWALTLVLAALWPEVVDGD